MRKTRLRQPKFMMINDVYVFIKFEKQCMFREKKLQQGQNEGKKKMEKTFEIY